MLALLSLLLMAPPPTLVMQELALPPLRVRVAHPQGWRGRRDPNGRALRLHPPVGEGEMLIVATRDPAELGLHLTRLKNDYPASAPSPPMAMHVPGIDPVRGDRATRFVISGDEVGEMVLLERGDIHVLIATLVPPDAWPHLADLMARCYATLEVLEGKKNKHASRTP